MNYESLAKNLVENPRKWLVTGAAGFIGSNIAERLLKLDQKVVAIDNFATGKRENIDSVSDSVSKSQRESFKFIESDISDLELWAKELDSETIVLHQAALGSVPRSIKFPLDSNKANIDGTLAVFEACRQSGVSRVVYASSSSIYGDSPELPKLEDRTGNPLSPYAVTKACNELYAFAYAGLHNITMLGLRYFNVFGPRQDPEGAYAAVVPRWIGFLQSGKACEIYGDGETSRDFCFVENAVQANLLAGAVELEAGSAHALNIACGQKTSLNEIYSAISEECKSLGVLEEVGKANYKDFRKGDIQHSLADISLAKKTIGYEPAVLVPEGVRKTVQWYLGQK